MRKILSALAWLGLFLTLIPPLLLLLSIADGGVVKILMSVGMVLWFAGRTPAAMQH
jgi:hypothetical protein